MLLLSVFVFFWSLLESLQLPESGLIVKTEIATIMFVVPKENICSSHYQYNLYNQHIQRVKYVF